MAIKQLKQVKGMRDIRALASDPTVDKVSGHDFRSPEEVKVFLDELNDRLGDLTTHLKGMERLFASHSRLGVKAAKTITIDRTGQSDIKALDPDDIVGVGKIVIKDIKNLRANFSIVTELSDKLDILDTLDVQVQHLFRGEKGNKIPAQLKATKVAYEKRLKDALDFLNKIAKQHEPKPFSKMVGGVTSFFKDGFNNKYDKAVTHQFVTTKDITGRDGNPEQVLVFNHYVQFSNLRNEHTDYTYLTYIIVYTAIVNSAGKMRMFVNTLHKFRAPGSFKPGTEFKDLKTGVRALTNLFEVDDFVDLLDRQPMPIGNSKVALKNFGTKQFIKTVDISDDKMTVLFNSKVTKENVQSIITKVVVDVRGLFESRMKTGLRYKVIPPAKGVEFILTLPSGVNTEKFMTLDRIDHLKQNFGMDNEDIQKLVQVFNRGYATPHDSTPPPTVGGPEFTGKPRQSPSSRTTPADDQDED